MTESKMSLSQIQTAIKYEEAIRDLADADEPWRLRDIESESYDESTHRKLARRGLITIQARNRKWGHKWSLTQPARAWVDKRRRRESDTPIADGGRVSEESDDEPPTRGIEMMEDAEVIR